MSHKVGIDVVVGSGDTISSNYNSEISFRNAENEYIKDPDYYPSPGNIVFGFPQGSHNKRKCSDFPFWFYSTNWKPINNSVKKSNGAQ